MKLIVFIFIITILIIPATSAITTLELKPILKEVLKLYFENPQNSRLSVAELRDLLITFFETPTGQEVNLNKIGKHSGRLLQEIYDKAKVEKWTIMVFDNADNNLERAMITDLNEMEEIGSSKDINVIVQFDRAEGVDDSNGNWTTTKRFYMTKDSDTEKINSRELADLGEVNMGDAKSLEDFLLFVYENYKAEHYMLILGDHGGGWTGFSNDDADDPDGMKIHELVKALDNFKNKTNVRFDIIGFDACSMSMFEVWYKLAKYADIGIGSEELIPGYGWDYKSLLKFLAENPDTDAKTLAQSITSSYKDYYEGKKKFITLSAVDFNNIKNTTNLLFNTAFIMNYSMGLLWKDIARAQGNSERFTSVDLAAGEYGNSYVDIYDFLDHLVPEMPEGQLRTELIATQNALKNSIISNVKGVSHNLAEGLSIYFPSSFRAYDSNYEIYDAGDETRNLWIDMLYNYNLIRATDIEPPNIKINDYNIQNDKVDFKINLSGDDISSLIFAVSSNEESSNYSIYRFYTQIPFNFAGFKEGEIPYSWDKKIYVLYNGEDITDIHIDVIDFTKAKYSVNGRYCSYWWDECFHSKLFFSNSFLSSVFIIEEYGDIPAVSEFNDMSPDDIFIPIMMAYDKINNKDIPFEGTPITVKDGLKIENVLLNESGYFFDFWAEDLSENTDYEGIIT